MTKAAMARGAGGAQGEGVKGVRHAVQGAVQGARGSVDEAQLLDVLYEILAQGGDPNGELTGGEVEVFLHEHARTRKSHAEMLAFFAAHELSTDPGVYATDPELGEIASGLHRERGPASSVFPLDDEPPVAEEPITGAHAVPRSVATENLVPYMAAPRGAGLPAVLQSVQIEAPTWLRVALVTLAMCIVAGGALSYARAKELEEQLAQARMQQHSTDAALTALEQRAGQLQASLGASETDRRALDAGLKTYIEQQAARRTAEQIALQKLLGPRYETLTLKALEETP